MNSFHDDPRDNPAARSNGGACCPLVSRAARVDPRSAQCFNGFYGEGFELDEGEVQRVVSRALIWADLNGDDAVPGWAIKEAWPEFLSDWAQLEAAAWERR